MKKHHPNCISHLGDPNCSCHMLMSPALTAIVSTPAGGDVEVEVTCHGEGKYSFEANAVTDPMTGLEPAKCVGTTGYCVNCDKYHGDDSTITTGLIEDPPQAFDEAAMRQKYEANLKEAHAKTRAVEAEMEALREQGKRTVDTIHALAEENRELTERISVLNTQLEATKRELGLTMDCVTSLETSVAKLRAAAKGKGGGTSD